MRRRSDTASDSLELLLDTITNAFGGILFLAILIVLLVNRNSAQTQEAPDPATQSSIVQEVHINELESQVEQIANSIKEQERTLADLTLNEEEKNYEDVVDLQQRVSQMELEREEFISRNKILIEQSERVKQEEAKLQLEIVDHQKQKATLEEELAKLRLPQIRTAKTPRMRKTHKTEFPVLVRYGRLYIPYLLDETSNAKSFNQKDFILIDDGIDITRVTPKPYRGILIDEAGSFAKSLNTILENLDEDDFYIAIATWSDSFLEFNDLRNAIVAQGFEYRIIPVEPGGFIQEGSIDEAMIQ